MTVFEFQDYKSFINKWISIQPKGGHGEYRRMANALHVSTTMISQVFKGDKHLSLELAQELSDYLNLNLKEGDFFLLLIEFARAGSYKLKERLLRQIKEQQEEARKLKNLIKDETKISEESKSIFYSSWMYSGIHLLVDIASMNDSESISQRLNLPRNQVQKILDFLMQEKLVNKKGNQLEIGQAKTLLSKESPLVIRHHQNWRFRSLDKMIEKKDSDFFYSAPMSMSEEVAFKIRQKIPNLVKEITEEIIPSKSETVRTLILDWFEY
ncbi:MAG: TIGR02147 family protein [Bdellovibrionales bacterium]|nr:TIGR02147 family protein [Bdellovibrionales bacterium]